MEHVPTFTQFEALSDGIFYNIIIYVYEPRISFSPDDSVSVSLIRCAGGGIVDMIRTMMLVSKEIKCKCDGFIAEVPLFLDCYYGESSMFFLSEWARTKNMKLGRISVDKLCDLNIQNIVRWSNTGELTHVTIGDSNPRYQKIWASILLLKTKKLKRMDLLIRREDWCDDIIKFFGDILGEIHLTLTTSYINDGSVVSSAELQSVSQAIEHCTVLKKLHLIPIRYDCAFSIRSTSLEELVIVGSTFNIRIESCSSPIMRLIMYEIVGATYENGLIPFIPFDRSTFQWIKNDTSYEYIEFQSNTTIFKGLNVPSTCKIRLWKSFRFG